MVDCLESGSTLRLLLPVFAAKGIPATFIGRGRLPQRPLGVYADCLPAHGVALRGAGGLPLTLEGRLRAAGMRFPATSPASLFQGCCSLSPSAGRTAIYG